MKTLEDLQLMTAPMLEGIHKSLTGNAPKKGMTKNQLVQRVYDLQQPDPVTADNAPNKAKSVNDATPPAANDMLVDDEEEGEDLIGGDPAPAAPADETKNASLASASQPFGDRDPTAPQMQDFGTRKLVDADADLVGDVGGPEQKVFPHTDEQAKVKDIPVALAHLPIMVHISDGLVHLTKGGKRLDTTVKQPLHRILATAEVFAR